VSPLIPVFDFDGTLLDSDEVLVAPFVALGIRADQVGRGRLLAEECAHQGVTVADYLAHYDPEGAQPFDGVEELVGRLDRWGVCSNKHPDAGAAELARLGWRPTATAFALERPKELRAVLDQLGVGPDEVVYIGDTDHDREEASAVGCAFALAGWNPRSHPVPGDRVLTHPLEVLALLG
jgi:HAD superfamily hydrolase (TIGR01549 family)